MTTTATEWAYDRDTGEHWLSLTDDASVKVYKSNAGDYVLCVHSDAAGFGGEVDFFETLRAAKVHGEKIAQGVIACPDGKTYTRN